MTREEAKQVFLHRGFVEVEGTRGSIFDGDKWREACRVISEWLEQESCEDCISRQALLNMYECLGEDSRVFAGQVVRDANALPSVTPTPKWIPCSGGLPKVADCYVVTRKIGSDLITSACFFDRPDIWYNDNRINHERNCLTDIVAWMPLPKPYKAERREEE